MLRIPSSDVVGSGSIAHLLDHVMNVWRPFETKGEARETIRRYRLVYSDVPCAKNRKNAAIRDEHGGLVVAGFTMVYTDPSHNGVALEIKERDVIELISGPESPALLEVESKAFLRGHHREFTVNEYTNILDKEEES